MIRGFWTRPVFLRMAGLCAAAILVGSAVNAVRADARRLSWRSGEFPPVEAAARAAQLGVVRFSDVRELPGVGTMLLDVRSGFHFRQGHLPGAISFPSAEGFDGMMRLAIPLLDARRIVIYGVGLGSEDGLRMARMLRECGFEPVRLYVGGYADWVARGGETESGEGAP